MAPMSSITGNLLGLLKAWAYFLLLPVAFPIIALHRFQSYYRKGKSSPLEGKVVLVTGSSGGIGESIAKQFYLEGCKIILAARRKNELERVRDELTRIPRDGPVHIPAILELDLANLKSVAKVAKAAIGIYGNIDILINNAGIYNRGWILETVLAVEQQIMNVNYFGTVELTKVIGRHMQKERNGHIVFISSLLGKFFMPYSATYSASKHALQAFADSLRAEISDFGIHVTVVSPGLVKTNISVNAITEKGEKYGKMLAETAAGYSPDYVAERTLKAVLNKDADVMIAPLLDRAAVHIQHFSPALFRLLGKHLARRFRNDL